MLFTPRHFRLLMPCLPLLLLRHVYFAADADAVATPPPARHTLLRRYAIFDAITLLYA